ncbi:MAG: NADH:flavin oxidoreductase [Thermoleophilia bacterium]|jgi:2,4-dienoyl-CoA reductase-like NADH-dependent reductase (Old Yellow Enzyme family)
MPKLFEPSSLAGMTLENRFVRSATWEGLATAAGTPTPELIRLMHTLALGGAGLLITGHAYICREGRVRMTQLGADSDALIPELARLVAAVHAAGGCIALQISHGGIHSLTPERESHLPKDPRPAGASTIHLPSGPLGRPMDEGELADVVHRFALAAGRARSAGFDAVQIHAAHGFLLSQFLSPFFNKREDGYGGTVGSRARLLLEVLAAVRAAVGTDYPVLVKMNSEDFLPDGLGVSDMVATAALLETGDIDALELSGGTRLSGEFTYSRTSRAGLGQSEAYYETAARAYKEQIETPLILVGGIRTLQTAERLVAQGITDYIALSRPLVREPDLVARWRSGDVRPATCISDNGCFIPAREGRGIACTAERRK